MPAIQPRPRLPPLFKNLQEKLAPLLCKTVWLHSARKLVWLYFCKKKRAFLQGPKSKKILHRKTRIGFNKQGKFQASAMALRYCSSTEVGTASYPQRKLDGQQPVVVTCFGSWSEPLGNVGCARLPLDCTHRLDAHLASRLGTSPGLGVPPHPTSVLNHN